MSVIVVIGGGPRPNATLYTLSPVASSGEAAAPTQYAIMDGNECLGVFEKQSYAEALLPLIQRGE